ncbi:hypothetical protein Q5424_11635 [Conexibacter sp. JD483]|uniref:hypothetical protein n=1 Tax=unclassified Conexibacter TaxID=2627773 RepID=UPI002728B044|nr:MULTISPECIES: hypothetical protein [unclassified Conexibacter]MDO8187939.1 hypothetical protein [Conexibacter sp. CPCC 205706]MDO8200192.1 hypothetical protein [Conexibacter sp. CPCC 205762]MDR9369738.1 hypothetical protein [Conexibacter sp. JD483]
MQVQRPLSLEQFFAGGVAAAEVGQRASGALTPVWGEAVVDAPAGAALGRIRIVDAARLLDELCGALARLADSAWEVRRFHDIVFRRPLDAPRELRLELRVMKRTVDGAGLNVRLYLKDDADRTYVRAGAELAHADALPAVGGAAAEPVR